MNFNELILKARMGDSEAFEAILKMYRPLLLKNSIVDGTFDEDLYQEQCVVLNRCIMKFMS